jgi:ubiquinone/menaquinone biosynthesis C-methylase UbiE
MVNSDHNAAANSLLISGDALSCPFCLGWWTSQARSEPMNAPSAQFYEQSYSKSPAENYERYFVPAIGGPVARDLIEAAQLQTGERVLDVACGTGVVTRLAAERVARSGTVAGLDVNPGMLAVARASTAPGISINWYEASAEAMPLPDGAFDVVLCQMGLQFMSNRPAALREMRRVLDRGARLYVTAPGPMPSLFRIMADALARHIGPQAAAFCDVVFSLHEVDDMTRLLREAGFREVDVQARPIALRLPAPADFLWQYLYSTPLAQSVSQADAEKRTALEQEVCSRWENLMIDGALPLGVSMTTATARK